MIKSLQGKSLNAKEVLEIARSKCHEFEYKAPIDINKILNCLGIKLEEVNYWDDDMLGEIEVKNGQPIIRINKANHLYEERERFTMAHELGHLCKHIAPNSTEKFIDTEKTMQRNRYWSIQEYEANNFAAQLLMPKDLIYKEIKEIINEYMEQNKKTTLDNIIEILARKFQVSKSAMRYRLKNLGII